MKFEIKNVQGFTLLELLITMVVAAVLLGIAIPSFQQFIQNSRLDREAQSLYSMFNAARQEAMTSGLKAFVCRTASADPKAADCNNNVDVDWNTDRISYKTLPTLTVPVANNNFRNQRIESISTDNNVKNQMVTSVYGFTADRIDLVSNSDDVVISFNANGGIANDDTLPFRVAICDERGEASGKYIEINKIGRIFLKSTTASGTDTDCTPL